MSAPDCLKPTTMPGALPAGTESPWEPLELKVPRTNHSRLIVPPPAAAVSLAPTSSERLSRLSACRIQGRSLPELRRWARQAVLEQARSYTAGLEQSAVEALGPGHPSALHGNSSTQAAAASAAGPLLVSGHQPAPAHPGVWLKNFLLGQLGGQLPGAVQLNLVVDQDLLAGPRMRVPVGTRLHPRIDSVPWDAERAVGPWEEAETVDETVFASFGERISSALSPWDLTPVLARFWPVAVQHRHISRRPSDRLTAARHALETSWGLNNLELPLSQLCELDPFLWFASHLLAHLPRFISIHNQVLKEYRELNGIRSRNHPVPELVRAADGQCEAPFWVWRAGHTQRQRVFARQEGQTVILSADQEDFVRLPLSAEMDACCAVEELRKLPSRGIRLRTRALTTTLFARLCLADVFVHGIGGAKYDEMTDRIIMRFCGLEPPGFVTASGTLLLPFAEPYPVTRTDPGQLRHELRDRRYNPERASDVLQALSGSPPQLQQLLDRKQQLIAEQQAASGGGGSRRERRARSRQNRSRFLELQEINRQLAAIAPTDNGQKVEQQLHQAEEQLAANTVLRNREFDSWLYPEEPLRSFLCEDLFPTDPASSGSAG